MIDVVAVSSHHVYHVRPEGSTELHPSHLYGQTLDHYIWKSKQYFKSNTTFIFPPGIHLLSSALLIKDVQYLQLKGSGTCTVNCSGPYGFIITNSSNVRIENLTISNCGQSIESIAPNTSTHAALAFDMVHNLTFSGITVTKSKGFGIYSNRVFGRFLIKSSTFKHNSADGNFSGGNALIYYQNCSEVDTTVESYLNISSSHFIYGHSSKVFPTASGLTLWLSCTNISARISNTNFSHNTGLLTSFSSIGGNLAIFYRNYTNITTNKVTVENCYITNGHANTGAGMYVSFVETPVQKPTTGKYVYPQMQGTQLLNISNTHFISNQATRVGAGLYIVTHEMLGMVDVSGIIMVQNCNFSKNNALSGKGSAALEILNQYLPGYMQHSTPQFNVSVVNCIFSENFARQNPYHTHSWSERGNAVLVSMTRSVSFIGCIFENNACSALAVVQSLIIFQGTNTFQNNRATHGGGLVLDENSRIYLTPNTTVAFIGNHAYSVGGGIFVQDESLLSSVMCFFELDYSVTDSEEFLDTMAIVMENNTADLAGNAIFGGSIDHCFMYVPLSWKRYWYFMTSARELFQHLFHIYPNDSSSVTSTPTGVCFCDSNNKPDCSKKTYELLKFPGETFQVSAVIVGQLNGTVPGKVIATLVNGSALAHTDQYLQEINNTRCNWLNYSVHSSQMSEIIVLTPLQSNVNTIVSIKILLSLKPCPLGFSLSLNDRPYCDCAPLLSNHGFQCNISDQMILRDSSAWVSVSEKADMSLLEFQKHCPLQYCKAETSEVYIKTTNETFDTDIQCSTNRTGILCGACQDGFSLTLGASQCMRCSSYYLLLVPAFALAGIALVLLLIICNLTVSEGTLSGLIFYANIVHIHSDVFFPPPQISSMLLVPIAWLNLDLGIETCFYDGMGAYVETWLQFVFPVYIWLLAGGIIILSRKYTVVTRLVRSNGIKVLATLFFLSYTKLLQTIIVIFYSNGLTRTTANGSHFFNTTVWTYDGNIEYLLGKHIPLFVAALLFAIVTLPYAFVLLFIQCLRRQSNFKVLFWVTKLKPFFDAYTGPYKDRCHFWMGLMLLFRNVLLLGYSASNVNTNTSLILIFLICSVTLTLAWTLRGVYRKWPSDILESSFFLNLLLLSASTGSGTHQEVIMYTSISITYMTLIGILIYHTHKQLRSIQFYRSFITWMSQKLHPKRLQEPILDDSIAVCDVLQPRLARFDQYREPLNLLQSEDEDQTIS